MTELIKASNISQGWLRAFRLLLKEGVDNIIPLTVSVNINKNHIIEDPEIRESLDNALQKRNCYITHTTANTIFPETLWNQVDERFHLYSRYLRILPELKRMEQTNRYGMYFERLINYCPSPGETPINQLEKVIESYQQSDGKVKRSALQVTVFNPLIDHTVQPRGFPCLQHVFFTPNNKRELTVTGVYATQYIFDRAYGNYVGLYRLGCFMAHEMGLQLTQIVCITAQALLGTIKKKEGIALIQNLEHNQLPLLF